jgi:hypothetical protein
MKPLILILSIISLLVIGTIGVTQGAGVQLGVAFLLALVAFAFSVSKLGSQRGGKKRNLTRPQQFGTTV